MALTRLILASILMSTASHPTAHDLSAGTHALCTCGLSKSGPFCDGSHQGTDKSPHILKLDASKTVYLCNCGNTGNSPFCDGSHNTLDATPTVTRPWWKFWS